MWIGCAGWTRPRAPIHLSSLIPRQTSHPDLTSPLSDSPDFTSKLLEAFDGQLTKTQVQALRNALQEAAFDLGPLGLDPRRLYYGLWGLKRDQVQGRVGPQLLSQIDAALESYLRIPAGCLDHGQKTAAGGLGEKPDENEGARANIDEDEEEDLEEEDDEEMGEEGGEDGGGKESAASAASASAASASAASAASAAAAVGGLLHGALRAGR